MKRSVWLRLAFVLLSAASLASCGGGGGGSSTDASSPVTVTASVSSMNFVGFANTPLPAQTINFSLVNGGSGIYYARAVADQPSAFQLNLAETSSTSEQLTISPTAAAAGKTSGNFTFELCTDSACDNVAWSGTIPYNLTVFSISSSALTISGTAGALSPATTIAISPADTGNLLAFSVSTSSGGNWLTASANASGAMTLGASAADLAEGNYQGNVVVSIAGVANSQSVTVPVSFNVGNGITAPAGQTVNLIANSTAATLVGSLPITFGGQNPAWTASSNQPWLTLNTVSGTGAGTIQYAINTAKLGSLANWSANTANITVNAAGLGSAAIPVTLNVNLPEVYTVSPGVVPAGSASTVTVTGRGLSQLSSVSQLNVAGVSGVTGTITSDTTATLNLPALAVGRATISVPNALDIATNTTTAGAGNLSALTSAFVANAGEQCSALYDPTRNAFYAINYSQGQLVRYSDSGGQWVVTALAIPGLSATTANMAMSPDRGTIYALSGSNALVAIDPDAMQIRSTYTTSAYTLGGSCGRPLAISNDMKIWLNQPSGDIPTYFNILNGTFNVQAFTPVNADPFFYPTYYASGDGSLVIGSSDSTIAATGGVPEYLAATDTFSVIAGNAVFQDATLTQDGSKMLTQGYLYNIKGFTLIGTLSSATGLTVLSPDGTRIYQLNGNQVQVSDTTQLQSGTSNFVSIGQIAVNNQAAICGANAPSTCNPSGSLAISPLGDTLFWVGNQGLVVIPIPSTISNLKAKAHHFLRAGR